jgi:DNA invertase Pin-like site-specific DNA recombinase
MSTSSSGDGQLIAAVGYLRRSTDKQEASIREQRSAVQRYADEHGYQLLRWYTDDAISGDETEKRADFQRMIADARERRDFAAILCWDQDRFGRFSPHEASYWTWPLARAGVQLVTIDRGPIDWSDFMQWLTYSVNQQGKHQFLKDLSRNVTRGQLEAAKLGSWIGSIPYAYRLEGPRKHKRLVIDDPAKVRIVQRIFREYVEEGRPMLNIANRLNADGVLSPGGRLNGWRYDSVKTILENPAYTGDAAGCRWSYGKYQTIHQGTVAKSSGRCRRPEADWIVHRDHHEAVIDRGTFAKAQAILARGKTGRSTHHPPDANPYVLAGLLRCGRCGSPLWGMENRAYRYYECGNRKYNGKAACVGCTVREDTVLRRVADHLEGWLGLDGEALGTAAFYGALSADDLPEAFAEVKKLVMPPARPEPDRKRLEKQAGELKLKLAKARDNLVLLDPGNIPAAQDRIRQLDAELAAALEELSQGKPQAEKDVNEVVLEVLHRLYALAYCCRALARPEDPQWEYQGSLESAAPHAVRRLLNRASEIVCHTEMKGRGNGTRHVFAGGEIVLEGVGVVTGDLNPHLTG